jgi:hypothetical protein
MRRESLKVLARQVAVAVGLSIAASLADDFVKE